MRLLTNGDVGFCRVENAQYGCSMRLRIHYNSFRFPFMKLCGRFGSVRFWYSSVNTHRTHRTVRPNFTLKSLGEKKSRGLFTLLGVTGTNVFHFNFLSELHDLLPLVSGMCYVCISFLEVFFHSGGFGAYPVTADWALATN